MIENGIAANAIFVIYGKVIIDIGAVVNSKVSDLEQPGVVKFLTRLLEASIKAQASFNQSKIPGQKLAAFSSQLALNEQFASTTITVKSKHELSSMTNVIGGGVGLPVKVSKFDPDLLIIGVL